MNFPQIRVKIPSGRKFREEFLRDLSAGGLFVSSSKLLDVGAEVQIQILRHDEDDPLSLTGKVVRVEEGGKGARAGMGVAFSALTPELAKDIKRLVDEYGEGTGDGESAGQEAVAELRDEIVQLRQQLDEAHEEAKSRDKDATRAEKQLTIVRERLEKLEAERDQLLTDKVGLETEIETAQRPKKEAAELETARREAQRLRERLQESEERAEELQRDLSQHQADEAVTRNLAERLANDKQVLEQKYEDDRKHSSEEITQLRAQLEELRGSSAVEIGDLRERLERAEEELSMARESRQARDQEVETERKGRVEAEARLDVLTANLKAAKEQVEHAEAVESKLRGLTHDLESSQERAKRAEERLANTADQLERARAKERDLRRLLAAVSPDADIGDLDEGQPLEAEIIDAEPVRARAETASAGVKSEQTAATREQAEEELELPKVEAAKPSAAPTAEPEDEDGSATKTAAAPAIKTLGPDEITDGGDFRRHLREGGRLVLTDRFSRLEPVSRPDIQVSDWLKEAKTLAELQKTARGRMDEDELFSVLYVFFQRALIRVEA